MTTRLQLIAHAPTEATRRHRFPLDEPADEFLPFPLDARAGALTSSALRCRQTARAMGADPALDARLDDWNLAGWAGRSLEDVYAEDPDAAQAWLSDPGAAPHGGESLTALLIRVGGLLTELAGSGGNVAAFTHPAVLRAATVHVLSTPPEAFWRVDVPPLSRLQLTAAAGRWNLRLDCGS